jgi:hypothetical protein
VLGKLNRGFESHPLRHVPASRVSTLTAEGREMYQIALRNHFHWLTRFPPGGQTTGNNKSVESLLPQEIRHTGAGSFALSSTVKIDVLVLGKPHDFPREVIWLDSNRSPDPSSAGIIVTMAAYVDEQDPRRFFRL